MSAGLLPLVAKVRCVDFASGTFGYDPANASLLGRQVSLQVVKRWGQ